MQQALTLAAKSLSGGALKPSRGHRFETDDSGHPAVGERIGQWSATGKLQTQVTGVDVARALTAQQPETALTW